MRSLRTQLRRLAYRARYDYLTLNNVVVAIALLIAASWAWGSVAVMQRNFTLQRNLEQKQRQLTLAELQVQTQTYEKAYYQSAEYQELSARQHLSLVTPGEKQLILPPNSTQAKAIGQENQPVVVASNTARRSSWQQWWDFLTGENVRQLQES